MRMLVTACIVLLAAAVPVIPTARLRPDAPDRVRKFVAKCVQEKPKVIEARKDARASLMQQLVAVKRGRIDRRAAVPVQEQGQWYFPTAASKQEKVQQLQAEISAAEAALQVLIKSDAFAPVQLSPLEIGEIGLLDEVKCFQVVSDSEMLATRERNFQYMDVMNVGGRYNLRQEPVMRWKTVTSDPFWVTGIYTKGFVDGRTVKMEGLYEVVGTKRYSSQDGVRTVLELRPFNIDKYMDSPQ